MVAKLDNINVKQSYFLVYINNFESRLVVQKVSQEFDGQVGRAEISV